MRQRRQGPMFGRNRYCRENHQAAGCKRLESQRVKPIAQRQGPFARMFGTGIANSGADPAEQLRSKFACVPVLWDRIGQRSPRSRLKEGSEMLVLSRKLGEKIYI